MKWKLIVQRLKLKFLKTDVEINGIKERFVLVYPSSYVKNSDMKIYPNLEKNPPSHLALK